MQGNEEKTKWLPPAGLLKIQDNGNMFVEMNNGDEFFVFEQKERTDKPAAAQEETIDVDDDANLPF